MLMRDRRKGSHGPSETEKLAPCVLRRTTPRSASQSRRSRSSRPTSNSAPWNETGAPTSVATTAVRIEFDPDPAACPKVNWCVPRYKVARVPTALLDDFAHTSREPRTGFIGENEWSPSAVAEKCRPGGGRGTTKRIEPSGLYSTCIDCGDTVIGAIGST